MSGYLYSITQLGKTRAGYQNRKRIAILGTTVSWSKVGMVNNCWYN